MDDQSATGRQADKPSRIPWEGWKDILWRVKDRIGRDRVSLVAAGTAFFLLLAIFPGLAALVSLYGLVADPSAVTRQLAFLESVVPAEGFDIITGQLTRLAEQGGGALSFGFLLSLGAAIWSANNGVKAIIQAMNVAYMEQEKRNFIRLSLFSLAVTLGTLFVLGMFIAVIGVAPVVLAGVGLGDVVKALVALLRWPFLIVVAALAIALVYRFAPNRRQAKWRWVTWGSAIATIGWIVASLLFSWYLSNLASFDRTYGPLGAVIGLLLWLWLSIQILIIGAELDAETERQTRHDSTVGEPKPMGARGAVVADTLGERRPSKRTSESSDADRDA